MKRVILLLVTLLCISIAANAVEVGYSRSFTGGSPAVYTDDFERADSNPIGSPWVTVTDKSAMQIVSGTARATGSLSGSYYNSTLQKDQYSKVTFASSISNSDSAGPIVRVSSTQRTYYELVKRNSTGKLAIYKVVNGTGTMLIEYTGYAVTIGVGATLQLNAVGVDPTTLTGFHNGTQIGTPVTDSDIDSGFVGMETGTTYNGTFDGWEGGEL